MLDNLELKETQEIESLDLCSPSQDAVQSQEAWGRLLPARGSFKVACKYTLGKKKAQCAQAYSLEDRIKQNKNKTKI